MPQVIEVTLLGSSCWSTSNALACTFSRPDAHRKAMGSELSRHVFLIYIFSTYLTLKFSIPNFLWVVYKQVIFKCLRCDGEGLDTL